MADDSVVESCLSARAFSQERDGGDQKAGYEMGPVEDFPSEGTREVYVGPPGGEGLLLLMEAIGPGPYWNAMEKRGPGLHHIAINVASADVFVVDLAGSGWLLHPTSLHTWAHQKVIYLARPGLRVLIEVQQAGEGPIAGSPSFHLRGARRRR